MDMLGNEATNDPSKVTYHAVQKKSGGIMGASSIIKMNRTQAKYLRSKYNGSRVLDKNHFLLILLEQCKR